MYSNGGSLDRRKLAGTLQLKEMPEEAYFALTEYRGSRITKRFVGEKSRVEPS